MPKYRQNRANTSDGRQAITAPSLAAAGVPAELAAIALEMKKSHGALRFNTTLRRRSIHAWYVTERKLYENDWIVEWRETDAGAIYTYRDQGIATTRGRLYVHVYIFE